MPALILLKSPGGASPGETIPLEGGETFVIGRDADVCQIVIPHHAVSRKHAVITRAHGQYYLEDLKSRNHTFLNNKEVGVRAALKPEDRIKICDFLFRFQDDRVAPKQDLPDWMKKDEPAEVDDNKGAMTTFEASAPVASARNLLELQPADRLRALLEISANLSKTLELAPLLPQVAETLFNTFKQADRCFVLLTDADGKPIPKVVKSRRPGMDDTRFSKTIVKKTLDAMAGFLSEDASSDTNLGPAASIAEFKIRSVMCVPLATPDGRPMGALQLDTQDRSKKFREDDLKLLTIVANQVSLAVDKARLLEDLLTRNKERRDIELAQEVQLGFLPRSLPDLAGYEFYSHYSPARTIGGDYYDFIQLPGGRLAVVIADVAGKGVPAALLTAKLSSEVRFCFLTQTDPGQAMSLLNEQMLRGGLGDKFITMAAAILDPAEHRLTLVNAGHNNPLVYRGAGDLEEAITSDDSGLPLGVLPGYEYVSVTRDLPLGGTVLLYTDGVTESMNAAGKLFDPSGLRAAVVGDAAAADDAPKKVGDRLVQAVRRHAAGHPQSDDIAVVCFGRVDKPSLPESKVHALGTSVLKRPT